jgi:hypothetical protein
MVKRRHKRYEEGALTRKVLDIAHEYLELQRLRIEVQRAEMQQKKKRPDQREDRKKR